MSPLPRACNTVQMQSIIQALTWREATRKFDTEKKLTSEQLYILVEAARLSPSSFGLQPWKLVVVSDPVVRAKLREASWNQPQITEASQLFVFAAQMPTPELVDAFVANISATRGAPVKSLAGLSQMIKGSIESKTEAERIEWAKKQAYLALGVTLASAAVLSIDACPMEGFDADKYDEILGLSERDLHTAVIMTVGFRIAEEAAIELKKVRPAKEDQIIEV
ncbi:NAD(P)H-dependent oxidoreductase [Candidatus Kaiserbacteria bacterium]|nr:NAD(P)H-dependent oxidoreductase [Candidatus Kaiserbacteria bacterium]